MGIIQRSKKEHISEVAQHKRRRTCKAGIDIFDEIGLARKGIAAPEFKAFLCSFGTEIQTMVFNDNKVVCIGAIDAGDKVVDRYCGVALIAICHP